MNHHFTYKLLAVLAVLTVAFAFTACDAGTGQAKEEATGSQAPESMETSEPTEEAGETVDENDMGTETAIPEEESTDGQRVFTLEELSEYDGKDGNPAYVAVDGVVYDVSDKPLWAGGGHQNQHFAGTDLSDAILKSPHGKAKLQDLPIVGTLAEE